MIYPEVIRVDNFHCRNHLLAEDLRLQPQLAVTAPQLAVAAPAAVTLEAKLNNFNNHGCPFGSMTLLI